jgi:hypothetical protein
MKLKKKNQFKKKTQLNDLSLLELTCNTHNPNHEIEK